MHDIIHDYYGRQLQHTDDLKINTLLRHQSDPGMVEIPTCAHTPESAVAPLWIVRRV